MVAVGTPYRTTVFTTFSNASHNEDTKGSSCDSSAYKGHTIRHFKIARVYDGKCTRSGWRGSARVNPAHRHHRRHPHGLAPTNKRQSGRLTVPDQNRPTAQPRDAIEHRLAHHVEAAARTCPSLEAKQVTTYTMRHTAAMRL